MYKIIVHPGSAHKDDFMAVSVLLATLKNAVVLRREPNRADLDDPDTYVVDVGMEHNPAKHNFDHHHNPALPCAFHLVMQHLNYHEAATLAFAWYPHMSMMDVRGPYRTAQDLGIDSSVLFASASPIDGYILALFSRHEQLTRKNLLYQFMKAMGQDLLALIERKENRLERLKHETRKYDLGSHCAIVSTIEDAPKLAIELYLRELDDPQIVMSITPAIRGEGWEMLRLNEHPAVDFLPLQAQPDISFVHANGFLAKTRTRLPVDRVIELARLAIVEPES